MARNETNAEQTRKRLQRKLVDPKDSDDPRWVRRILESFEKRIARKEKAHLHKQQQRRVKNKQRDAD